MSTHTYTMERDGKPVFELSPEDQEKEHAQPGTYLGFWIYLMSDCLIFAALFATYAVVGRNYAMGPAPVDLFDLKLILVATFMLLFSSITYGFAMIGAQNKKLVQPSCGLVLPACSVWLSWVWKSMSSATCSTLARHRKQARSCHRSSHWSVHTACTLHSSH
jgi:heme/copper-type cytochrome/quinol oxidase subunit 3